VKRHKKQEAAAQEKEKEKQIWIGSRNGNIVCDSLKEAALYASKEAGVPVSEGDILAAITLGYPFCGMRYSYTKPETRHEARPPLLGRNALEEGIRRSH
jgi:hypothetical protein